MRVRMLATAAGPDRTLIEGREYTLDDAEAAGLVEGNYAEEVPEPAPAEEEPQAAPPDARAGGRRRRQPGRGRVRRRRGKGERR